MTRLISNARLALSLMDLTSLNDSDTDDVINALCEQAKTPEGSPAALCVYPQFIKVARAGLDKLGLNEVNIATVTNFPDGSTDINRAINETRAAVADGADEVDVVFPYKALIEGDADCGKALVSDCKAACGSSTKLKVIIESGELKDPALIRQASEICIEAGADFIKTSTGKVPVNATLEAAEIMLSAIKDSGKAVGFKAAGGIRSAAEAGEYIAQAQSIMGKGWVNPDNFRFGASSLLSNLLSTLGHDTAANNTNNSSY